MKGIWVYQPAGKRSQVASFVEGLEPHLREKVIRHLYQLSLPQKPEIKEPHYKRFSLERHRNLCEVRVKSRICIRVVSCPCPNGGTLLLHAFVKRRKRDAMFALEESLRILDVLREHPEHTVEYKVEEEGV